MQVTQEKLIKEIRRIAKHLGQNQLSGSEFRKHSGISQFHIYKLFDNWNDAIEKAGLIPHTEKYKISNDALFAEMERVFITNGGICTRNKFNKLSKIHADSYYKRFGRWNNILAVFHDWLDQNNREFPFMDQLTTSTNHHIESDKEGISAKKLLKQQSLTSWDTLGSTTYGPFLNFRGLQHAPLNEQGVVFLFGMISFELGFVVEAIRNGYPDCEAKRRIDKNRDQWERVRIEFEYRSKNFKEHGHNLEQCDIIICWIHDWKECPLEVIELKSVIKIIPE